MASCQWSCFSILGHEVIVKFQWMNLLFMRMLFVSQMKICKMITKASNGGASRHWACRCQWASHPFGNAIHTCIFQLFFNPRTYLAWTYALLEEEIYPWFSEVFSLFHSTSRWFRDECLSSKVRDNPWATWPCGFFFGGPSFPDQDSPMVPTGLPRSQGYLLDASGSGWPEAPDGQRVNLKGPGLN